MYRYLIALATIVVAFHSFAFAQNNVLDSLNGILRDAKHDTTRAQVYIALTEIYAATNIDTVIPLCEKAIALADAGLENDDPKVRHAFHAVKVSALNNIGYVYSMKDEVLIALEYYEKSKVELELIGDRQGLANYYISVAYIYNNQGDVARAIDYNQKSYEIQKEIGDKHGAASSLNNIAVIYNRQGDTANALAYFLQALTIYREANEKIGEATALNNMAAIYEKQGDTARAMNCYRESLRIRREEGDVRGVGSTLTNIGVLYEHTGQSDLALRYYREALPIREGAKDKKGAALTLVNIAALFYKLEKHDSAIVYGERALQLAQQIGYPEAIATSTHVLSETYAASGNFKEAYKMSVLFKTMSDSINNDASRKASLKSQMKYEFDKREEDIKTELDKQNADQQKRSDLIIYAVSTGFLLMLVSFLFIYRGYRQKQRANDIIMAQKTEVETTKHILEEKNKDILDSLNYARRIQRAKLPDTDDIQKIIPESFILFQPKDIVSGDFYFFKANGPYVFLAAADCTGHGVPGALMSMIGYERLSEAVQQSENVSKILNLVNKGIKESLRQTEDEESTRDGMDIALCRIDLRSNMIQYAGANRPLWFIRRGEREVHEIKATKRALGGHTSNEQEFELHEFELGDGDALYLFSDGYADQFHGETGKKLTTKKFKEILLDIQSKDLHGQEVALSDFGKSWKKDAEQIDDILVIGVRL